MTTPRAWQRTPYPLGATWMGDGVNFAVFSQHATRVDLCLFDQSDTPETARIPLQRDGDIWHGFFPDLRPGQLYGFRAEGPYAPAQGHRFNARKLLLDPHARAIAGPLKWDDALFGHQVGKVGEAVMDERDSASFLPKAVVIDGAFDWEGVEGPRRPWSETVIYEVHVKGFTQRWNAIPEELRGTYGALGSATAIAYFKKLGVTAVELLPIHQKVDDRPLVERKLVNYWGYNTIGFFAPEASLSSRDDRGGQVAEFKEMVKNLHRAGIEVILDVVYNHTAEGNELGPTLCFRGLDNAVYYRLQPDDLRRHVDFTGCGNSLNVPLPPVLRLVLESLRYWVTEMRVDGFRFDLASTLAREYDGVSRISAFFAAIHQDPVLSRVKLIAEPWDIGAGGYQVGGFPWPWAEWNGRFRDALRLYWKGEMLPPRQVADRLAGSPDLYAAEARGPLASVNFLTAHDGFTLHDLVTYNEKHNLDNGEENRDGDSSSSSWNCGEEGPSENADINRLRRRQRRNFLATLLLAQGVPMLCGGDEYGRTQNGNNNAYCQDGPMSWFDWERSAEAEALTDFVSRLAAFRREHPVFRVPQFLAEGDALVWLDASGREIAGEGWEKHETESLGMLLGGDALDLRDAEGNAVRDEAFLLCFNGHTDPTVQVLPGDGSVAWETLLDTAAEKGFLDQPVRTPGGQSVKMEGRSLLLLRQVG
jgi:isoamylase